MLCGRDAVQISPASAVEVDLSSLKRRLSAVGDFELTPFLIRGRLTDSGAELTVFRDGRAIVGGVTDEAAARAVYARTVGT